MDLYIFLANIFSPKTYFAFSYFCFFSPSGVEDAKPKGKMKQISA